jgi:hypothetical protein
MIPFVFASLGGGLTIIRSCILAVLPFGFGAHAYTAAMLRLNEWI